MSKVITVFTIVFVDGQKINIIADHVEWNKESKTVKFYDERDIVARINMDNIIGWINSENIGMVRG